MPIGIFILKNVQTPRGPPNENFKKKNLIFFSLTLHLSIIEFVFTTEPLGKDISTLGYLIG